MTAVSPFRNREVAVSGVAQTPLSTRLPSLTFPELLTTAAYGALEDSGLDPERIDGLVLGLAPSLLLGVERPEFWATRNLPGGKAFVGRVHTAAASGLSAIKLAAARVAARESRHVLVVAADLADETPNLATAVWQLLDPFTERGLPINGVTMAALQMSAYMALRNCTEADLARITVKNRANGAQNPYAQLRKPVSVEEVLGSRVLAQPVKLLDGSPRTSGAAAAIVSSASDLPNGCRPAYLRGFGGRANRYAMGARLTPEDGSYATGSDLTAAASSAYEMAGVSEASRDLDFAEIYASFNVIEAISTGALGLAPESEVITRLRDGAFDRDGALPVNPSGGATCGNPISATGLLRVAEAVLQIRGEAGAHQVLEARQGVVAATGGAFQLHEVAVLSA